MDWFQKYALAAGVAALAEVLYREACGGNDAGYMRLCAAELRDALAAEMDAGWDLG